MQCYINHTRLTAAHFHAEYSYLVILGLGSLLHSSSFWILAILQRTLPPNVRDHRAGRCGVAKQKRSLWPAPVHRLVGHFYFITFKYFMGNIYGDYLQETFLFHY